MIKLNSITSNFKETIKNYSIQDKKSLLQLYQNRLNILSQTNQHPLVVVCNDLNISNIEYKSNKSKQVTIQ